MDKKQPAIILNSDFNALSICQELNKLKIKCYVMDFKKGIAKYSKYNKFIKCPNPINQETEFINFLYNFCIKLEQTPIIIPTMDSWALAISKSKNKLSTVAKTCVSEFKTVDMLIDKEKFANFCKKNNLGPKTWTLNNALLLKNNNFPIVAKIISRNKTGESNFYLKNQKKLLELRLVQLKNKNELEIFIKKEKKYLDKIIFQEYIPGNSDQMYTIGIYANYKNELLGIFTGKKIRGYPANIGDCIVGANWKVPKELIDLTKQIVKQIKYQGIAEFEFKYNVKNKKYYLIEINPRSWSWIGITSHCNVNLCQIAYKDIAKIPVTYKDSFHLKNEEVIYKKVLYDVINCTIRYKNSFTPWHMNIIDWIKDNNKGKKIVYAEFSNKDYLVGIISILLIFKNSIRKLLTKN